MPQVLRLGIARNITVAGASARTGLDFTSGTTAVLVTTTTAAHIKFGDGTVNATTSDTVLPAGASIVLAIPAGATRLAAIQNSTGGTMSVTELL